MYWAHYYEKVIRPTQGSGQTMVNGDLFALESTNPHSLHTIDCFLYASTCMYTNAPIESYNVCKREKIEQAPVIFFITNYELHLYV